MKCKYGIGIVAMLVLTALCFSQDTSYSDSLELALANNSSRDDSLRTLVLLTWDQVGYNDEKAVNYGLAALELLKGSTDSALIADVYDAGALAYKAQGNIEKAKEYFLKSLHTGLSQQIPMRIAWAYYNLEAIAVGQGDMQSAREYSGNAYRNFLLSGNNTMASKSYWMLIENNQADYIDTLIIAINKTLPDIGDETSGIFSYLELTNLYNKKGDRKQAMQTVQKAMELADRNRNLKGTVKAYSQIAGYFYEVQKNYSMALVYYNKALELLPSDRNDLLKADLYLSIGEMNSLLENDSLALDYYNRALKIGQQFRHRHTMASAYMKLGEINYCEGNFNDARYFYSKSYETNCDVCPRIVFHPALVSIGNVHLHENELQLAEKYFRLGLDLADSSFDLRARVRSLQSFADLYEKRKNIPVSIDYHTRAYHTAAEDYNLEGKRESAEALSRLYHLSGEDSRAYDFLSEAKLLSDSINQRNEIDNLAKLETYFDFKQLQAQKELEKSLASEEIGRQKLLGRIYISGAIILALFGLILYLGYRRKKNDNLLLKEQKQSLERMSKKVHEADQLKLQFFTNISHEFKTPLTLIMGMTEKLREKTLDKHPLDQIRKNSLKLLQLVNHLLDLRKIDTLQMKLRVREDDIVRFTRGVVASFETMAHEKNIELVVLAGEEKTDACFDHEKLEKIISNLVSNGLKFTPRNGRIEIELAVSGDGLCYISVRDNGIGISQKEMKNIFRRFYRVDQNGGQGTGIGLALVKELVRVHHGSIKVESIVTGGTCFEVKIPVRKHFYQANELAAEAFEESSEYKDYVEIAENIPVHTEITEAENDKKIILVVEDNADLRNYISGLFSDSFEVLEAADGKQGCELARKYIPDIIISDIMMPGMSGLQLVDMIKLHETTSHIPVILLTAKDDIGTRLSGFEKGADEYISKPFDSGILISRVENLLRLRKQLRDKFASQYKLQPREITIENSDKLFLEKTIAIIEKHIADPNLNVDLLSMELGVSRTQLYRKLNALTEYPPKQFIRIIRLKRAAQVLRHGQNNIAEVMDATGFSNYSFFNNCFREYFGEYPKDYALISIKNNLN